MKKSKLLTKSEFLSLIENPRQYCNSEKQPLLDNSANRSDSRVISDQCSLYHLDNRDAPLYVFNDCVIPNTALLHIGSLQFCQAILHSIPLLTIYHAQLVADIDYNLYLISVTFVLSSRVHSESIVVDLSEVCLIVQYL
jgi:hypothetical protein